MDSACESINPNDGAIVSDCESIDLTGGAIVSDSELFDGAGNLPGLVCG